MGLGLMIAASGGVGGGGILVPLLIIVYGFHPKYAIPLSNFTILGSSITNMVLNIPKRHPGAERPLVDWDLILVMEPLTMAGAVRTRTWQELLRLFHPFLTLFCLSSPHMPSQIIGALVGKVLPDWLLVISLVALLAHTTYTTLLKAKQQYDKETAAQAKASKSLLVQVVETEIEKGEQTGMLEDVDANNGGSSSTGPEAAAEAAAREHELLQLLDEESRTPFDKAAILSVMVLVTCGLNVLKGGGGAFVSPLGIVCGSQSYWAMTGATLAWILAISLWMRNVLIDKWRRKARLAYKYIEGDVEWNERNTIVYPCICFFAGFFAGMFGVGGGIVKGPLMLQMGVHPLVASATTAVMIMFTSVAATTMYVSFGMLTWDYAWFLFVVGLVTTTVGQFGVGYFVDKYKRYSFISMSIGAVVAISTVLLGMQSVFSLADASANPQGSAGTICG